jgi:RNA polymerase sigma factor (sigma-70 family)
MNASDSSSNLELVERCLNGDAAAWQELVMRYANLVHSVPVRYGLSPMEVDDVGQEVFLILAQSLHQIDDPERLPGWLTTTARRVTWRIMQKRRREQPAENAESDDPFAAVAEQLSDQNPLAHIFGSTPPTMQELLDGWSQQEAVQKGMSQLEGRCQQLIILLFLDPDEPSYDEISQRLDMPVGSIGPTRNRCLHRLRRILEGLGFSNIL